MTPAPHLQFGGSLKDKVRDILSDHTKLTPAQADKVTGFIMAEVGARLRTALEDLRREML